MSKISVVINTYQAERYLRRVLESVRGFDEVVVCDMESRDGTVAVAREFGCRVVTFPKADHVSAEPARTFAIQSATSEWVLVVDADELVTDALRQYLYAYTEQEGHKCGLYIPRRNFSAGRWARSTYPDYQLRFFKREGAVWPPYVHTFPTVAGPVEHIAKEREDLAFIHLPRTVYEDIDRMNRYSEDELRKRAGKHVTLAKLLCEPTFRFVKYYILKAGFRQGVVGFNYAVRAAIYKYFVLRKLWEAEQTRKATL